MTRAIVIMFLLGACYFTAFGVTSGLKQPTPSTVSNHTTVEVFSRNELASHNEVNINGETILYLCVVGLVLVLIFKKKG